MKRRFVNSLTALSLALLVATAAIWVRSYFAADYLTLARMEDSTLSSRDVGSERGHMIIETGSIQVTGSDAARAMLKRTYQQTAGVRWIRTTPRDTRFPFRESMLQKIGFLFDRRQATWPSRPPSTDKSVIRASEVVLPDWFLLLVSVILPIRWLVVFTRNKRQLRVGHCSSCGYDLRETPNRCPECGTIPPPPGAELTTSLQIRKMLIALGRRLKLPIFLIGYWATTLFIIAWLQPGLTPPGVRSGGAWAKFMICLGTLRLALAVLFLTLPALFIIR